MYWEKLCDFKKEEGGVTIVQTTIKSSQYSPQLYWKINCHNYHQKLINEVYFHFCQASGLTITHKWNEPNLIKGMKG